MKIKLAIIDTFAPSKADPDPFTYYITEGRLDRFLYSPQRCNRVIETVF
jgi:hypothetical protein